MTHVYAFRKLQIKTKWILYTQSDLIAALSCNHVAVTSIKDMGTPGNDGKLEDAN